MQHAATSANEVPGTQIVKYVHHGVFVETQNRPALRREL
jgi:hypothetical protein